MMMKKLVKINCFDYKTMPPPDLNNSGKVVLILNLMIIIDGGDATI